MICVQQDVYMAVWSRCSLRVDHVLAYDRVLARRYIDIRWKVGGAVKMGMF
jgi:hypothetical protein